MLVGAHKEMYESSAQNMDYGPMDLMMGHSESSRNEGT